MFDHDSWGTKYFEGGIYNCLVLTYLKIEKCNSVWISTSSICPITCILFRRFWNVTFNKIFMKLVLIIFVCVANTWSHHLILWRNHFVWLPEVWIFLSASLGGWNRTEFFCILIVNLVGDENQLLWEKFQLPTKSSEKMTATFWSSSSSKGSWITVKMGIMLCGRKS